MNEKVAVLGPAGTFSELAAQKMYPAARIEYFEDVDEVFKYVDSAGGEAVIEMLNHLRQERSSIFVIEHDEQFKSHFENRLTVRKLGGRSTILTEAQRGQETQQESQGHAHAISEAIGAPVAAEAQPKRKKARRGVPAGAPSGSR